MKTELTAIVKHGLKYSFILCLALGLAACNASNVNQSEPPKTTVSAKPTQDLSALAASIKTEADCTANQGSWQKVGLIQRFACTLPASDAGKACNDSGECQVSCIVQGDVAPGTPVTGQCHASTNQFGCMARVNNGKAEPALCID